MWLRCKLCKTVFKFLVKDKADLLLEVENLSVIKNELTSEVSELHECLEKERSKVSKLKDELQVFT